MGLAYTENPVGRRGNRVPSNSRSGSGPRRRPGHRLLPGARHRETPLNLTVRNRKGGSCRLLAGLGLQAANQGVEVLGLALDAVQDQIEHLVSIGDESGIIPDAQFVPAI